jgi:hypothetical protein
LRPAKVGTPNAQESDVRKLILASLVSVLMFSSWQAAAEVVSPRDPASIVSPRDPGALLQLVFGGVFA